MNLSSLRTRLFQLLPVLFIMLAVLGIGIFSIQSLLPRWQSYQSLATEVQTQNQALATQFAAQSDSGNAQVLQAQIQSAQATLNSVGNNFLTDSEAAQVLNRLYAYAYSRGVRIVNLQAQQPSAAATASAVPYITTVYQLQVSGGVANLIDFISHFQEASLPGVSITSMSVSNTGSQPQLTMTLLIYTSPYASGKALSQISTAEVDPPDSTPTPTGTVPPSAAALLTVVASATLLPSPTPTSTPTSTATFTATLSPTLTSTLTPSLAPTFTPTRAVTTVSCPGALPTLFKVGDIAVVHFSGLGALRVLSDPNGPVMSTRTQAYDQQRLLIISGPVCVNSTQYWYIRNLSHNNDLGWVGEGQNDERWLCPESDPKCS